MDNLEREDGFAKRIERGVDWAKKDEMRLKKYSFINFSLNSYLKIGLINNIFYYQSTTINGKRYSSPNSWSIKANPQTQKISSGP